MSVTRWLVAATSLALAILAAVPAGVAQRVEAAPQPFCLALGDSLSAGIGSTLPRKRGYHRLVCDLIATATGRSTQLVVLAVPGETTRSFLEGEQLARLHEQVDRIRSQDAVVSAVMVSLGGNDLLELEDAGLEERRAALDRFRQDYATALAGVRNAIGEETPLVVLTVYDLTEGDPTAEQTDAWWVAQFNTVIRQAAAEHGAAVADLEPVFRGHIAEWTWYPADVHPNNDGYEQIARLAWQALGIDRSPPAVDVERPDAGTLPQRYVTVRVRAHDETGVDRVELQVGDRTTIPLSYLPAQDVWIALWDSREIAGTVTLTVRAFDVAGHVGESQVTVSALGGSP